jgi:hypothetical protein
MQIRELSPCPPPITIASYILEPVVGVPSQQLVKMKIKLRSLSSLNMAYQHSVSGRLLAISMQRPA